MKLFVPARPIDQPPFPGVVLMQKEDLKSKVFPSLKVIVADPEFVDSRSGEGLKPVILWKHKRGLINENGDIVFIFIVRKKFNPPPKVIWKGWGGLNCLLWFI